MARRWASKSIIQFSKMFFYNTPIFAYHNVHPINQDILEDWTQKNGSQCKWLHIVSTIDNYKWGRSYGYTHTFSQLTFYIYCMFALIFLLPTFLQHHRLQLHNLSSHGKGSCIFHIWLHHISHKFLFSTPFLTQSNHNHW